MSLGLSFLSECSRANPQKLVVTHCISLRAMVCRSAISGPRGSVTFSSICFLFFPFMELVVLAVDFVDLSPIKVKQQGLEISKNVFSLSKIIVLAKSAFKD